MPIKDPQTQEAIDSLKNPNFSPNAADANQPLLSDSGVPSPDFTNATNDINKSGRVKLGQYLSNSTKGRAYPISDANELSPLDGRLHARGNSLTPIQSEQTSFAGDVNDSTLQYSGLGIENVKSAIGQNRQVTFFTKDQLEKVISKTAFNEKLQGDNLLSTVPRDGQLPSGEASPDELPGVKILRDVREQLSKGNRYTSEEGKPFIRNEGGQNEEEVTRGLFTVQRTLGFFNPEGQTVTKTDMLVMANAMMARAAGDSDVADSILQNGDPEYTKSFTEMLAGIINVTANAGVPIDNSTLRIGENLIPGLDPRAGAGQDAFLKSLRGTEGGDSVESAIQMNYSSTQFESSMFLMTVQSMLLLVGAAFVMSGIIWATNKAVDFLKGDFSDEYKKKHFGQRKLEKIQTTLVDVLLNYLGVSLPDLHVDFYDAFLRGLPQAIGISSLRIKDPADVLSSVTNFLNLYGELLASQGYYSTFFRSILKSGNDIIAAAGQLTFTKLSSLKDGPGVVLQAIQAVTGSKLWSFVIHCANLGDILLLSVAENSAGISAMPFPKLDSAGKELVPQLTPGTSNNRLDNSWNSFRNQHTRWGINQVGNGSYPWKVGQPMAMSLQTFVASQNYVPGAIDPSDLSPQAGIRDFAPTAENVKVIEDMIEGEYMPFYMHDLRTNEIISMPAFITEFGETFSPKYNDYKGVGRQDAVKIYGGTERQVTFGFMLVAYSQQDHDILWWNVNKLVAMCYPQYSKGRIRNDGSQRFIQPFSQVQAASPLIRLRLGDVFKSNYSKFGLARLFGVNTDIDVKDDKNKYLSQLQIKRQQAISDARDLIGTKLVKAKADASKKLATDTFAKDDEVVLSIPTYVRAEENLFDRVFTDPYVAVIDHARDGRIYFKVKESEDETIYNTDVSCVINYAPQFILDMINKNEEVKKINDEIKQLNNNFANADFFVSKNTAPGGGNSIVRSFESTRGRGVAGVITNLGLDYGMGSYPWNIEAGSRAPNIVKISLGFSPITDLPLGLDYDGNIRNPSHPVGKLGGSFGDVYDDIMATSEDSNYFTPTRSSPGVSTKTAVENSIVEILKKERGEE